MEEITTENRRIGSQKTEEHKTGKQKTVKQKTDEQKTAGEHKTGKIKTGDRKTGEHETGEHKTEQDNKSNEQKKTRGKTKPRHHQKQYTIMHGNIQCLRNKTGRLEVELQAKTAETICLSEHWLKEEEVASTTIEGYHVVSSFCRRKFKNGGVIIFAKEGSNCTEIKSVAKLSVEIDFECVGITWDSPYGTLAILCVYRAPSGNLTTFHEGIEQALNQVAKKNRCDGDSVNCRPKRRRDEGIHS